MGNIDIETGGTFNYKQKQNKLKQAIKEANDKEFDEWMTKLIAKNGTTNY